MFKFDTNIVWIKYIPIKLDIQLIYIFKRKFTQHSFLANTI